MENIPAKELKVKIKEPTEKSDKMMKISQKDGNRMGLKQGQKAGKKKKNQGPNISYWLPWWKRMEREAEKSLEGLRETRISAYFKLTTSNSISKSVCSSESYVKRHHPREEKESVQDEFSEGSSSYDNRENVKVAKERPQRAVPTSVSTFNLKLNSDSNFTGRKRGRNSDFKGVGESPAKKSILTNHGSRQIGGHSDN